MKNTTQIPGNLLLNRWHKFQVGNLKNPITNTKEHLTINCNLNKQMRTREPRLLDFKASHRILTIWEIFKVHIIRCTLIQHRITFQLLNHYLILHGCFLDLQTMKCLHQVHMLIAISSLIQKDKYQHWNWVVTLWNRRLQIL